MASMVGVSGLYRSAVGKKAVMAVTGLILFGFVLGHMFGNLKLYDGAEAVQTYAGGLRTMGAPFFGSSSLLWVARIALLLAVLLHIHAAWAITMMNRNARPVAYSKYTPQTSTYASRTMRWGGIIVLLFIVWHLLDLTFGTVNPRGQAFTTDEVYQNVVSSFSVWWISAFYIVANIALGLHLFHGLWSMFQSLGLNHPRYNAARRTFAALFASLITVGNVSFPVAVLLGIVK